ncbi:hypothetical protein BGZ88_005010, partial [Linnemannia elongata]
EHIPRDVEKQAALRMTMLRTASERMIGEIFSAWLDLLDDELEQPTLLLLDSAGAHNNVDLYRGNTFASYDYPRIQQRLPSLSTPAL